MITYNRVKLGKDDTVDTTLPRRAAQGRKVLQRAIKLGELVDGLVTDKSLADKDNLVGVVDRHELGERTHERLIVLHTTGRVDEHYIETVLLGWM